MLTAGRNRTGLTERQIEFCRQVWALVAGNTPVALDTSEATRHASRTRFNEAQNVVNLGADALPGVGIDANSRMSTLACLTHEFAHAERFRLGYRRPTVLPDVLLDEAETSVRASFARGLPAPEREDLIEDARDRLIHWLALRRRVGQHDES